MIVDGVKAFLVFLFASSATLKNVNGLHAGLCIAVDGHSPGTRNFCERCENETRSGLGIYWTGQPGIGNIYGPLAGNQNMRDDFMVNVTRIRVDGVELEGWFHISIQMPKQLVYVIAMQVEEEDSIQAAGELTTDLLAACQKGDLTSIPTAAQITPCQATPLAAVNVPNSMVYSREANVKDGIIRSITPPSEFHVNWKISPSYSCASPKIFYVQVSLASLPPNKNLREYSSQCPNDFVDQSTCTIPNSHFYNFIKIHLPPMRGNGQFRYPHPIPPFYDPSTVDCQIPMTMNPLNPDSETKPYLTDEPRLVGQVNWFPPRTTCVHGAGFVPRPEIFNASLKKQPLRSLYLGRCTERVDAEAGAEYSIPCTEPKDMDDRDFINSLSNVTQYIEDVRYDICGCDGSGVLTPEGGSLTLDLSGIGTSSPTPTPDYPDITPNASDLTALGLSENNGSRLTKTSVPIQKILRKINRTRFLHSLFSSVVFIFLIPVSIFSARYLKESFYRTTAIVDIWYRIHLIGIVLSFICFTIGQFILIAGNYWVELLKALDDPNGSGKLHGGIGWVVIFLFAILATTGGLRPYNPNSNTSLKIAMYFHAGLGFGFYYLGLITMMVTFLGSSTSPLGISLVLVWIVIDICFHIIMTIYAMKNDRASALPRSRFPVMELIYDTENSPGEKTRKMLFFLYIVLSLTLTGLICYESHVILYSEESEFNTNRKLISKSAMGQRIGSYF